MKTVNGTWSGRVFATVVATAAVLATAQATVNTARAANLAPNGDFEKEDHGTLAAWMPLDTIPDRIPNNIHGVSTGYVDILWETRSAGHGSGSLVFKGRGTRLAEADSHQETIASAISPKIPVHPETEYRLSFSWMGEGLAAQVGKEYCGASILVKFYAGNGKPGYANHFDRLPNRTDRDRDTLLREISTPLLVTDANRWKRCEFVFKTPLKTSDVDLCPVVSCTKPLHRYCVHFDDLVLEPLGGPAGASPDPDVWRARSMPPRTQKGLETGEVDLLPSAAARGNRIQRTMKLLATSTPERRNRVRILCYGQSIIEQAWWRVLYADLKARYPSADLVMENRALGGFMADTLKFTAETDLYPADPDLVIFHDYKGNPGPKADADIESIYAAVRSRTTAEVLTLTHHLAFPGPENSDGMFRNYMGMHDAESRQIRQLAAKYGCEVAEVRENWKRYVEQMSPGKDLRLAIQDYLQDQVHLCKRGERLMETIVLGSFQYHPDQPPYWLDEIKVYTPDGRRWPQQEAEYPQGGTLLHKDKPLRLEFQGSRVDVIGMPVTADKPGSARVLIDGRIPSEWSGTYVATRCSAPPRSRWPLILRVELGAHPVAEDWTLTYTQVTPTKTPDGKPGNFAIEYDLQGSLTGADGRGSTRRRFVSNSGRIALEPEWFLDASFMRAAQFTPTPGSQVKWRVLSLGLDVWKQRPCADPACEDRYVLAQGLPNGKHTLELIPHGDGPVGVRAIVVHRPRKG